ncbi:hypothetical protein RhiirA4_520701, partial [Rhizophagus irregularis]
MRPICANSSTESLHTSKHLASDITDEQEPQIIPKTANKTSWVWDYFVEKTDEHVYQLVFRKGRVGSGFERNVNTISGEFTYQNPLPRLLPERNFTTPTYFLHNESAVRDFSGVSGVNYFDLEREATELRALEKEQNPNADKASNAEINNEKEKENIAEVEQEPKNNPKKKSVKRKVSNDTDSNVNWQDHEIDLLIQYIGDNFDEYRKGNKTKMFNEISSNVLKNKEPNAIKSKLARLIKTYSEVKKHNEKSGEARKDWVWYDKMDAIFGA